MEWLKEQATAIIAGLLALGTAAVMARGGRKTAKELAAQQEKADEKAAEVAAKAATAATEAANHQLSYDQLQEDVKRLDAKLETQDKAHKDEMRDLKMQHSYQMRLVRHLDDEIVELRQDVAKGDVPPLKPRKPWPPMPGEVVT